MSATDVHVYRTRDPHVLAAWENCQRDFDSYLERRKDQLEAWGFDREINMCAYRLNPPPRPPEPFWVCVTQWCPYGRHREPMRAVVELGDLEEGTGRFQAISWHLMADLTDGRYPRVEITAEERDQFIRRAYRADGGSSFTMIRLRLTPAQRRIYGIARG